MTFRDQIDSIVKLWIRAHGPFYKMYQKQAIPLTNEPYLDMVTRMTEQVEAAYQKGLAEGKVAMELYQQRIIKTLKERGHEDAARILKADDKRRKLRAKVESEDGR